MSTVTQKKAQLPQVFEEVDEALFRRVWRIANEKEITALHADIIRLAATKAEGYDLRAARYAMLDLAGDIYEFIGLLLELEKRQKA